MSVAMLVSDADSIDLFNSPYYKMLDGSLEISNPEKDDVRVSSQRYSGRNLKYLTYRPRTIKFVVQVLGVTDSDASDNVVRLSRMLNRASSQVYLSGGTHSQTLSYSGKDTGDQGVIFQFRLGDDTGASIATEYGTTIADTRILTARVIDGDVSQQAISSTARKRVSGGVSYFFRDCEVSLEVEPIFTRTSRIVSSIVATGFTGLDVSPTNSNLNRIIVPAASIPGDAEALTRISTQIGGGQGILMGRDSGISLLNCASSPIYAPATGATYDDMFCYGDVRSSTGHTYVVKIVGTSSYQWKKDAGSFSGTIAITANVITQLGAEGVYIYFLNTTGHITNDTWTFKNNQAFFAASTTYDAYTNRATLYTSAGGILKFWNAVVPPGCTSKYKCYVSIPTNIDCEYKMTVNVLGYGGPSGRVTTGTQEYDWVKIPAASGYVDLGVIDLSPTSSPFLIHPGILSEIQIAFYVRATATIPNPSSIVINGMYLIPCPDEHSYFHAVWTYDGYGREIYCNYDPSNPYIAEVAANWWDNIYTATQGTGLNATYAGNVITLIPGVDNTIIMVPVFSASSMDWRYGTFASGTNTGAIYLAIKPRYIQV